MPALTLRALNRTTLARQLLLERTRIKPKAAVEQLAGMQAQVPKPPFIGLWSRLENFKREDLARGIAKHELVRATMMRGTLHLVTREDFVAFRPALRPVLEEGGRSIAKNGPPMDLERLLAEARTLYKSKPRTFEDVREQLTKLFPQYNDRLMGYTVRMHLPLVMVPDDSLWSYPANCEFTLGDPLARDAAAHDLVLRYLAAFGPATAADFQVWSGLNARAVFEELRPKLTTVRDERGRELFDVKGAKLVDEGTDAPVRFLPEFDNLLLAHADRSRIIADEHRPKVATKNLRILATFLVDGFVAGTWSLQRKKTATLTIAPFAKLTRAVRDALADEGERLVRFAEEDAAAFAVEFK